MADRERVDSGPELPRRERYGTVLGSLVVVAVIVVLVGTLTVVNSNVSGEEAIPSGTTVEVGQDVTYVPANGWFIVREGTLPGTSQIAKQGSALTVQSTSWLGDEAGEVERLRRRVLADTSVRLTGDSGISFHTGGGLTGTRLAFVSPKSQGRAWVALDEATRRSVVVVSTSAPETYAQVAGEVDAMVDSIRLVRS